jgi:hypothetical protein
LQQANGGKKNKSELVLGVNTVQTVETRVCNNPHCGVTFTPSKPSFYSCKKCFKGGNKKGKKGQAFQVSAVEVGSDNDGEDENSDSHEIENSKRQSRSRRKRRSENVRKENLKSLFKIWLMLKQLTFWTPWILNRERNSESILLGQQLKCVCTLMMLYVITLTRTCTSTLREIKIRLFLLRLLNFFNNHTKKYQYSIHSP